ncbi:SBBP repeat-containing protein [Methanobacterium alcaliphilum]|uniref:SBBP repeat-containing protein n=1 Tax=Methanobacterium alcaliphilum TaxID=392018 RepID=UPI00200AF538|nr:SBBP repeat-containing protein [Methanobacterium alcaliphilum]MCK9150615.1 SBBP repeat-containing protein [Methanobacterium alcaliphilum]
MNKHLIPLLFIFIITLSMSIVSAEEIPSKDDVLNKTDNNNNVTSLNTQINNANIPFIENQGQSDTKVKYYADTFYGTVYVTNESITHSIKGDNNTTVVIKEQFLNKEGDVITFKPIGYESGSSKVDYYQGVDSSKWQTGLNTWSIISLGELYPGIELFLRANGCNIEKIFIIQPGANPDHIQIQLSGADQLEINSDGSLNMKTIIGNIQFTKPIAFQEDDAVSVDYKIVGDIYSFQLGTYNTKKPLTIDPTLQYSTYIGQNRDNCGYSITTDNAGNIYVVGYTDSSSFPTTAGTYQNNLKGTYDVFIVKLTPNNQGTNDLKYSTYIGGSNYDFGYSIAVDNAGNIYITGATSSDDFPTTTGAFQKTWGGAGDAFLVKLTPNNQGTNDLKYSTYIGGSGDETAYGLAIDNAGNVYITGYTDSTDFPTTLSAYQTSNAGYLDVFVVKLTPNNQGLNDLKYSTYLGGSNRDCGYGITIDNQGNIYVTGYTWSQTTQWEIGFPTTMGAYQTTKKGMSDVFITKISPNSQGITDLKYSTYLGESGDDVGQGITIDNAGNIYITGYTDSTDFPTTVGAYQTTLKGMYDAIIVKLTPNNQGLNDLKYSTYLGGTNIDYGWSISSDNEGNIYIGGYTYSEDYPTTPDAYQTTKNGGSSSFDAFISKLTLNSQSANDLKYSTYLGGSRDDYGYSINVDPAGNIYITGYTYSNDFPTTTGAYQTSYQGSGNVFIVKLGAVADLSINKTVNTNRVRLNDTVYYTILVQNNGPDTSFGIHVNEVLPEGLKYISSQTNYGIYDPKTGIWTINYLPNNTTAVLTIKSIVERTGIITNTVRVSALTYDPVINNTISSATILSSVTPNNNTNKTNETDKTHHINAADMIRMQDTGVPFFTLLLALIMIAGGFLSSKKIK